MDSFSDEYTVQWQTVGRAVSSKLTTYRFQVFCDENTTKSSDAAATNATQQAQDQR